MARNRGSRKNPVTGKPRQKVGSIALAKAKRDKVRGTRASQKRYDKQYRAKKLAKVKRQQALWWERYGSKGIKAGTTRPKRGAVPKKKVVKKKKEESLLDKARRTGLIKRDKPKSVKKPKVDKRVKNVQKQVRKDSKKDKLGLTKAQKKRFIEKGEVFVSGKQPKGPRGGRREGAGRKASGLTKTEQKRVLRAAENVKQAKTFHEDINQKLVYAINATKSPSKKQYLEGLLRQHKSKGVITKKTDRNRYSKEIDRKLGQGADQAERVSSLRKQLDSNSKSLQSMKDKLAGKGKFATSDPKILKGRIKDQEKFVKELKGQLGKAERDLGVIEKGKRQKLTTEKEANIYKKYDDDVAKTAEGTIDKRFGQKKTDPAELKAVTDKIRADQQESTKLRMSIRTHEDPASKMAKIKRINELEQKIEAARVEQFRLQALHKGTSTERVQKHRLKQQELKDRFNQEFYGTTDKYEIRYNRVVEDAVISTKSKIVREATKKGTGAGAIVAEGADKVKSIVLKVDKNGNLTTVNPKHAKYLDKPSALALEARNYQASVADKGQARKVESKITTEGGYGGAWVPGIGGGHQILEGSSITLPPVPQLSRRFKQLSKKVTVREVAERRLATAQRNAERSNTPEAKAFARKNKAFADKYFAKQVELNQTAYIARVNQDIQITKHLPKNYKSLTGSAKKAALTDAKVKAWSDKTLKYALDRSKSYKEPVTFVRTIGGKKYAFTATWKGGKIVLSKSSKTELPSNYTDGIYYKTRGFVDESMLTGGLVGYRTRKPVRGEVQEIKKAGEFKSIFDDSFQVKMVDDVIKRGGGLRGVDPIPVSKPRTSPKQNRPSTVKSKGKKRVVDVSYARKNYNPKDYKIVTVRGERRAELKVGALKNKP